MKNLIAKSVLVLSAMITMISCRQPQLLLADNLKNDGEAYPVKGRNGVMIRQKMSFGNYYTSEINRGWLKSYDIPFIVRFSGASEKLAFELRDSVSMKDTVMKCRVHCLGKVRRQEFELVRSHFGIVLKEEDAFTGNIWLAPGNNWDFIVYNASNTNATKQIGGFLKNGQEEITIRAIRKFEGKNTVLSEFGLYGYEFVQEGKVLGAVDVINKGRVIFAAGLSPSQKQLLAGLSAALLLKTDLDS